MDKNKQETILTNNGIALSHVPVGDGSSDLRHPYLPDDSLVHRHRLAGRQQETTVVRVQQILPFLKQLCVLIAGLQHIPCCQLFLNLVERESFEIWVSKSGIRTRSDDSTTRTESGALTCSATTIYVASKGHGQFFVYSKWNFVESNMADLREETE